eukprot:6717562-Alexandrium_andersonii.AAC.1
MRTGFTPPRSETLKAFVHSPSNAGGVVLHPCGVFTLGVGDDTWARADRALLKSLHCDTA